MGLAHEFKLRFSSRPADSDSRSPEFIVLATDPLGTGGIQTTTRNLISALGELYGPKQVRVISLWRGGEEKLPPCKWVYRGRQGASGKVAWLHAISFTLATVRLSRKRRGRKLIILACHSSLAPVAWLGARASKAKFVVWCYGKEVWKSPTKLRQFALKAAERILAISQFTAQQVRSNFGVRAERVTTVPLGVSVPDDHQDVAKRSGHRVLSVCRLAEDHRFKGIDSLIRSWSEVVSRIPGAELSIVGDGPGRKELEDLVNTSGLCQSIHFRGRISVDELREEYMTANVFALPGRVRVGMDAGGEGFGLVFVEAAAAGLPVVAGLGGGSPEVVLDGQTGMLVDAEEVSAVAEAIVSLLRDPDLARELGEAGRIRALNEYSFERFRDRISCVVSGLLSGA